MNKTRLLMNSLHLALLPFLCSCGIKPLPLPEIGKGYSFESFEIDKNINFLTIDNYLHRDDVSYRDVRMLEDPANYEAIGGDRFLSGYIDSFEVAPLPYFVPIELPPEVTNAYSGPTLFKMVDDNYLPNFVESISIVESIFPKDKAIFLMCGGGGYAFFMKKLLLNLGYDKNKLYNIGGYWYYEGKNSISTKIIKDEVISYDFSSVPYHEINFEVLHSL